MSESAREKNLSVSAMSCSTKQQTIMQHKEVLSSDSPLSRQPETGQQENGLSNKTVFPPIQIVQRKDVLSNNPASSPKQQLQEIVPRKNSLPNSPLASPRPKSLAAHQKNSLSTTTGTSSPRQRANSLATPRAIVQHRNSLTNSPAASPRERARTLSNSSSVSPRSKNSLSTSAASSPRQNTNNLSSSPAASPRERARTLSNSSTISPLSKNSLSTSAASSPRQSTNSLSNSAASSPRQSTNSLSSSPLASPSPKVSAPQKNRTSSSPRAIVQRKEVLSNSPASSPRQRELLPQKNVLSNSPASSPRQRVIAGQKNVLSSSPASSPSKGSYFPELREGYKEATGILKNFEEMANAQELNRKDSGFSSTSSAELLREEEEAALKAKEMEKTEENLKELGKLAKLFDKQGLEFTDAQPKKADQPPQIEVPLTVQLAEMRRQEEEVKRLNDGAIPITLETALALRKLLFGTGNYTFNIEWKRTRFTFRDVKSNFPYGLFMEKHGSRGMTMCVQAYILKHLLYKDDCLLEEKGNSSNLLVERFNIGFFEDQREDALIHALADILWKAGEGKYAAVTIVGEKMCISPSPELRFDNYTEKILIYEFTDFEALLKFLRRNLDQFQGDFSPGGILMVYSAMLSRTFPKLVADMDEHKTPTILTAAEACTTALINLFLTGRAVSYLFNGKVVYDKKKKPLPYPLLGQKERAELGFLFWDKTEFEVQDRTEVGSMLKTPKLPIWLTSVNDVFGILFCTVPDLLSHWRKEHRFCLFYFTGQTTQIQGTKLTIDNRSGRADPGGEEEEQKIPSLERCILTKWPDAVVNWNGTSPFV